MADVANLPGIKLNRPENVKRISIMIQLWYSGNLQENSFVEEDCGQNDRKTQGTADRHAARII